MKPTSLAVDVNPEGENPQASGVLRFPYRSRRIAAPLVSPLAGE